MMKLLEDLYFQASDSESIAAGLPKLNLFFPDSQYVLSMPKP